MEEQLKRLAEEMEQVRSPPGHHEENLGYRKIPTILREITVQSHRKASLICCACPGSDRLLFELLDLLAHMLLWLCNLIYKHFTLVKTCPLARRCSCITHYSL